MGKLNQNDPFGETRKILRSLDEFKNEVNKLYDFIIKNDAENQHLYDNDTQITHLNISDNSDLRKKSFEEFFSSALKIEIKKIKYDIDLSFKGIIDPKLRISFLEGIFSKLDDLVVELDQYRLAEDPAKRLSYDYIKGLEEQLHIKFDEVLARLQLDHPTSPQNKLKINLSRVDLVYLLLLLKDGGIIDCTDYRLGKFLEEQFLYSKSPGKIYSQVTQARKEINKIRNGALDVEKARTIQEMVASAKIKEKIF